MTVRELSPGSDARCETCGEPAAGGAAIDGCLFCISHAQQIIWRRFEEAAFVALRYCGRSALEEMMEGVLAFDGNPVGGYTT